MHTASSQSSFWPHFPAYQLEFLSLLGVEEEKEERWFDEPWTSFCILSKQAFQPQETRALNVEALLTLLIVFSLMGSD